LLPYSKLVTHQHDIVSILHVPIYQQVQYMCEIVLPRNKSKPKATVLKVHQHKTYTRINMYLSSCVALAK